MLLKDKSVAIVGGGPGGLTLAKLLELKGVNVKVYERDTDKNARVQGSSLDLHDESSLAALRKAGLFEAFKTNFMRGADKKLIMNEQAEVFFSDHEEKIEEDFENPHFRPEIDRGVLRKILLESLQPATVVWDHHFISMEKENNGWLLNFKNSPLVYADIVIASDGANSKIRPYLTDIKPFYSGITMLEGNIPDAINAAPNIYKLLSGGKIMAFGNEKNILMGQKANEEIGFYASFKAEENWATNNGLNYNDSAQMLDWFNLKYPEWSNIWNELFERALIPFIPRPIYCMPLDQQWETVSNLTIIGDAAHVMPPFAGEGVNMAMLDALELSEHLTSHNHVSLKEAISAYETNMRKRASVVAKESLDNGELMHSKNALNNMLSLFASHKPQI